MNKPAHPHASFAGLTRAGSSRDWTGSFSFPHHLVEPFEHHSDTSTILKALFDSIHLVIPFESGAVYLLDHQSKSCVLRHDRNLTSEQDSFVQAALQHGLIKNILSERHAVSFSEALERAIPNPLTLVIPLLSFQNPVGFVILWAQKQTPPQITRHLKTLLHLGRQAAKAIENQFLIDRLQKAGNEVHTLQNQLVSAGRLTEIGLMASSVAHEIRNPLQVILASAQILSLEPRDEKASHSLRQIEKEATRICDIIGNILRYSRSRRQPARQHAPVKIEAVIEDALRMLSGKIHRQAIHVERQFDSESPALPLDPVQIEQVFVNLFENAIHAMKGGGTLSVRTETQKHAVKIHIADTGHGIPDGLKLELFKPFFTTKPEGEGTGLGLFISQEIVKRNGGSIQFESSSGRGTVFTLSFSHKIHARSDR
ncbi:MAG: ATP-binding protein [Verrucomicrobiae bacterium]|nr:ATP-binding protein [Verrucomicrobiae bacterium]